MALRWMISACPRKGLGVVKTVTICPTRHGVLAEQRLWRPAKIPDPHIAILYIVRDAIGKDIVNPHLRHPKAVVLE